MLGDHRFDVTHRAVVIHRLDATSPMPELLETGSSTPADALLLAVAPGGDDRVLAAATMAILGATDRPVIVRTSDADVLADCLTAGAAGIHLGGDAADPRRLARIAESCATAIIAGGEASHVEPTARAGALLELATFVRSSGVRPERVAVDVTPRPGGLRAGAAASLEELALVARGGCAAMVELTPADAAAGEEDDDAELVAAATLLVVEGARLLVTDRPRPVRRVAFVLSELLAARSPAEVGP